MGGYDQSLTESTIRDAWEASIEAGVVLFDTAEVYGGGESERIIGRLLAADPAVRSRVVIATKFMPSPWKVNVHAALLSAARHSLERLGCDTIDLYQIHGPISLRSHDALAEALAAAHAEGLVKAVGVSNYSAKETRSIDAALRKRGLRLASNQIEFSLLRTHAPPGRASRLLSRARRRPAGLLADRPRPADGQVLGRPTLRPGGRTFSAHPMEQVDAIVAELRRIGEAHDGRTPSQVALAWLIAQGAVPIPERRTARRPSRTPARLGWQMTDEEVAALDAAALFGKRGHRPARLATRLNPAVPS